MKTCSRCGESKPTNQFNRDRTSKDGYDAFCKECCKEYSLQYESQAVQAIRQAKAQPCTDCGVSYPYYVMDLDHVRGKKLFCLGTSRATFGIKKVLEEIAKCEPVCANCHRERTHQRMQIAVINHLGMEAES